jgi:hypothetical protein
MADDATTADAGCGCCEPESKTVADRVRELETRREILDRRLRQLAPVGAR